MTTIYRLNAQELDGSFLESIKQAFQNKNIEIAVSETDETEYLLRSPNNRQHLLEAIEDVAQGKNIVTPDQQQFA
ncbi:MAG: hypothetical protein HYZ34_11060 [Ignavibacteriae bacterium]|nr:hypothetical protein [Ignavibacteriota bacterium]